MLIKVETQLDHVTIAYKVLQDQLHEPNKEKFKGQAVASIREHSNTCAFEIEEDMDPSSTLPVAMGEIAKPQENREGPIVMDSPDHGDQLSRNEEKDKLPSMGTPQILSSNEGNQTFLGFDSEGNEMISNVYPIQPVQIIMSMADVISKIRSHEHSTSHVTMRDILTDFSSTKNLFQYNDNLLIATCDKEKHLRLLEELRRILGKTGQTCNPIIGQAQLSQESVSFLGITVAANGSKIAMEKVKIILQFPLTVSMPTLRSFRGVVNYLWDIIPDGAHKSAPLYVWGKKEQHTNPVQKLKEALAQAPVLANPEYQLPFHIETAISETALSAVLAQEIHGQQRPILYVSKALFPVERKHSLCEKHLLDTLWAVKYYTYIIGLNTVILHMPTKFLLTDRVEDGNVFNARQAHWALLLQNQGIKVKQTNIRSTIAHGLLFQGTPHECAITPQSAAQHFSRPLSANEKVPEKAVPIFTDGSCFYVEGSPHAGLGIYIIDPHAKTQTSIFRSCQVKSAKFTEMAAIAHALEMMKGDQEIVLYTDSAWVCKALTEFLPFGHAHQYMSSDGSPRKHVFLVKYIVTLVQKLPVKTWGCKVKGHIGTAPYWEQNDVADCLAKQGAQGGEIWEIPLNLLGSVLCPIVCAFTKFCN